MSRQTSSSRAILDHCRALSDPPQGWRGVSASRDHAAGVVGDAQRHGGFVEIRLWGEEWMDFLRRLLP
jgi:hypothetical protein